ncbi:hypothetical protein NUW58_g765 [Xylaria curta]|uniref:Uncharacterized protein n=1 Tax=Xylaria curta TaxID=42375 RepID=A0ACC1PP57_9PEZI|nr:hypothetical protein NUW58_g765 [Xylaria curta]
MATGNGEEARGPRRDGANPEILGIGRFTRPGSGSTNRLTLSHSQHLSGVKPLAESGFIKTGGAIFNEKPESDDASKFSFYGSTLVCVASSKEEILELLSKDIYATTGVWDLDKVGRLSQFNAYHHFDSEIMSSLSFSYLTTLHPGLSVLTCDS